LASINGTGLEAIEEPLSAWIRQLVGIDPVLADAVRQQSLRREGVLPASHHPAHHVTTVDVDDHVQVVIGPLGRTVELGDVPAPHRVGLLGYQLRLDQSGVDRVVPSLVNLISGPQDAVHS